MKKPTLAALLSLALAPALALAAGPNDAQIAAIVVTAKQVDIDAGQWAASHTASADVKSFATLMVTDHTAVTGAHCDRVVAAVLARLAGATGTVPAGR